MTLMFNPVEFIHRLEKEGLPRGAAEAIALGIDEGRRELATKEDLLTARQDIKADLEKFATKLELERAIARQTIQFGIMLASGIGIGIAIAAIGVIVSFLR